MIIKQFYLFKSDSSESVFAYENESKHTTDSLHEILKTINVYSNISKTIVQITSIIKILSRKFTLYRSVTLYVDVKR